MDELEQDLSGFTPLYAVSQGLGVLAVVLTGVWMGHYRGGFAWSDDDASLRFNWHPLLMVLGLVYLYGNGLLVYRVFRHERKKKLKVTHAVVNASCFVLAVAALRAVFGYHAKANINDMYSLHSWLGLITVSLFAFQWLCGLVAFLFPGLASHLRATYLPVHAVMGMGIFVLACVTSLLGMTEKAIFSMSVLEWSISGFP